MSSSSGLSSGADETSGHLVKGVRETLSKFKLSSLKLSRSQLLATRTSTELLLHSCLVDNLITEKGTGGIHPRLSNSEAHAGRNESDRDLEKKKELYHPGIDNVTGREWPQSQLFRVDLEKIDCFPVEKI